MFGCFLPRCIPSSLFKGGVFLFLRGGTCQNVAIFGESLRRESHKPADLGNTVLRVAGHSSDANPQDGVSFFGAQNRTFGRDEARNLTTSIAELSRYYLACGNEIIYGSNCGLCQDSPRAHKETT